MHIALQVLALVAAFTSYLHSHHLIGGSLSTSQQPVKPAPKPWYNFLGTHEFIGGVAIVTSWLTSLPKITWHDALGGLGGLLAAFGVGRANNTPS